MFFPERSDELKLAGMSGQNHPLEVELRIAKLRLRYAELSDADRRLAEALARNDAALQQRQQLASRQTSLSADPLFDQLPGKDGSV